MNKKPKKKFFKKPKKKKANPVGRPPFYKTDAALKKKIEEYFKNPPRNRDIYNKDGEIVGSVSIITITGLVLYLGFCDRAAFYDYGKKEKFCHTIKKARTFIEQEYEECLKSNNCTGAIFALKNFGWTDRRELELSGKEGGPVEVVDRTEHSEEQLARAIADKLNKIR